MILSIGQPRNHFRYYISGIHQDLQQKLKREVLDLAEEESCPNKTIIDQYQCVYRDVSYERSHMGIHHLIVDQCYQSCVDTDGHTILTYHTAFFNSVALI